MTIEKDGKWKMGEKKGSGMGESRLRWIEGHYSKPVTASRPIKSANEERNKKIRVAQNDTMEIGIAQAKQCR